MVNAVIIAQAAVILIILTAIILLISDASGSREQKMMSFFCAEYSCRIPVIFWSFFPRPWRLRLCA